MNYKNFIWACERNYLQAYLEKVNSYDPNKAHGSSLKEYQAACQSCDSSSNQLLALKENKAIISINGAMMNRDQSIYEWIFGIEVVNYKKIIEACNIIKANSAISDVEIMFNTPGGAVIGCEDAYNAIKMLAAEKNVTAINCGMIASAGYWLACACDKIISTTKVNMTGSIGVVIEVYDDKEYLEDLGIKRVVILSENAPNKRPDISTKEGVAELKKGIDAVERIFLERVSEGRNVSIETVKKDFGQGGMFIAQDPGEEIDALTCGMIDGIIEYESNLGKKEVVSKPAASAGINNKGGQVMTLKELLAQNPAAASEHEALLAKAKDEGKAEGKTETEKVFNARIEESSKILASKTYPEAMKNLAVKTLKGESSVECLSGAIVTFEALSANNQIANAVEETASKPETSPEAKPSKNVDPSVIDSEEAEQKAIEQLHNEMGGF